MLFLNCIIFIINKLKQRLIKTFVIKLLLLKIIKLLRPFMRLLTPNTTLIKPISWILVTLLVIYWGVFAPAAPRLYTWDEFFITDGGVFMWYGLPPRALEWPAGVSCYLYYFIWLGHYLYNICINFSAIHSLHDALNWADFTTFQYLTHIDQYLMAGRVLQILFCSVILWFTNRLLLKYGANWLNGSDKTWLTLLLAFAPYSWYHAFVIRPDILAIFLIQLLLVATLFCENLPKKHIQILLFILGVCLAQRITFLLIGIVIVGSFSMRIYQQNNRSLKAVLGNFRWILLGFVLLVPFIMTQTLTFLKSFVGVILNETTHNDNLYNWTYIKHIFDDYSLWFWLLLSGVGLWHLFRKITQKFVFALLIISFLLNFHTVFSSGIISETRTISCAILGYMAALGGVLFLKNKFINSQLGSIGLVLWLLFLPFRFYQQWSRQVQSRDSAYSWVMANVPNHTNILVHELIEMSLPADSVSLQYRLSRCEASLATGERLKTIMPSRWKHESVPAIARAVMLEEERILELKNRILLKYNHLQARKFGVYYYLDENPQTPWSLKATEALHGFETKKYDYMLTTKLLPNKEVFVFFKGRGHWVYVYKNQ
jgi:hypothetical protein